MFLSDMKKLSKEFSEQGYIVKKSKDQKALIKIRELHFKIKKELNIKKINDENFLNNIHDILILKILIKYELNLSRT